MIDWEGLFFKLMFALLLPPAIMILLAMWVITGSILLATLELVP